MQPTQEKYWYHTSTENEHFEINQEKEQQTGTASHEKKKKKEKEQLRTKDPDDGSPKLQQLQAISKIDKNQPQSNCSSEIAKRTTIFMATVTMDYSQSKQTTKQWHYCQQETEEPVSSQ